MFGKFEGRIALVPGGSSGIEPSHAIRNGNAPQLPRSLFVPGGRGRRSAPAYSITGNSSRI